MFFSHTTKFFVGPTSGCYGPSGDFKAHLTEPTSSCSLDSQTDSWASSSVRISRFRLCHLL
jgi:hypothetical protein